MVCLDRLHTLAGHILRLTLAYYVSRPMVYAKLVDFLRMSVANQKYVQTLIINRSQECAPECSLGISS